MLAINPQQKSEAAAELLRAWQAWTGALASATRAPDALGPIDYPHRHAAVLHAISLRRRETGDDPLLRHLEALAAPWSNWDAYRTAAEAIRDDLVEQCRQCELELCGYRRRVSDVRWRPLLAVVIAAIVCGLLAVDTLLAGQNSVLGSAQTYLFRLGFWIRHSSLFERIAVAAVSMFAIGWWATQKMRTI